MLSASHKNKLCNIIYSVADPEVTEGGGRIFKNYIQSILENTRVYNVKNTAQWGDRPITPLLVPVTESTSFFKC